MCRSIRTLREPYGAHGKLTADGVRKVSGFRRPAAHNAEAFDAAVQAIAHATRHLLADLRVGTPPRA